MNWSDYEAVWKRQTPPVGAHANLTMLKETFEMKSRKMAVAIQVRDYAEASAGILVAAFYGFYWWQVGPVGWPLAFGLMLILWVVIFFLRERLRARRHQISPDAPLLTKISVDLAELHYQRRLGLKVWAWYIAPCAGAMFIQLTVIVRQAKPWDPIREPLFLVGVSAFLTLICLFVWFINRRAIRKQIDPRIAELEKLQRNLLGME